MIDHKLVDAALREIEALLKQGVLPVHNGHLKHLSTERDILDHLVTMKREGLISGDLVTIGSGATTPHRMTNIRLTYLGIRALRDT